jgi:hypothetical protein
MKKNGWYFENNFYYTSDKSRTLKILDQYEIYKKISKIKGDVLEFGVFKGASLIRFLTFRDLTENSRKRKIYGFDIFGKFPNPKKMSKNFKADKIFAKRHDQNIGLGIKQKILKRYLKQKKFNNFELIKGNVVDTLSPFIKKNKNIKISLLHLDLDTYEPTKFVLETLFNKLSKNAIILLDDYKHIKGATLAINEFLKKNNLKIKKVSKNGRPHFIEKI